MKTMFKVALAVGVLGGVASSAFAADKAKKATSVMVTPADLKWEDVPNMTGIQKADVQGDPSKGAGHFFVKFAAGTVHPLHHHTAEHSVTVVSGTLVLTENGKDTTLPAGSFFWFKSKAPHGTKCTGTTDCIMSIETKGKWDVIMEKTDSKS